VPRYRKPHIKFLKEKKKVVPQVEVSRKTSFFRKNTTRCIIGNVDVKSEVNVVEKRYGWRFLLKPAGLELFFIETGTYLYFLLFIFLFSFLPKSFCWKQKSNKGLPSAVAVARASVWFSYLFTGMFLIAFLMA
jgi:hypothetical protein